jgi:3-deoxy-D-arabino-heptulosonate 7-phosphate (DAHP) synthase
MERRDPKVDTNSVPNRHRRRILCATALTVAAAELGVLGSAAAQAGEMKAVRLPAFKPRTNTSFTGGEHE